MKRSRYDELHDKYHALLTTKAGTRYERLAAIVFVLLEQKNAVIHDLSLSGEDPDVKHQIDVTVESSGATRRTVIECKDFDLSGDKVGLGIIRDFRSVIEDTKADEGVVLTCNGFTEDAQKYARSKGIKLAVLRKFESKDKEGRILKINFNLTICQPKNLQASLELTEPEQKRYKAQVSAAGLGNQVRENEAIFFVRTGERLHFNDFLSRHVHAAIPQATTLSVSIIIPPEGWRIQVEQNDPIDFVEVVVKFDIDKVHHTFEYNADRIAELILSGFGSKDLIVFGDQIDKLSIDPITGVAS